MLPEIYFAQIREDARLEQAVCEAFAPKKIVCIGSGGCTAFSLLADHVQEVIAVDYNSAQAGLIELKKAAIAVLNRETFLAFIGEKPCADRNAILLELKPMLPEYAQKFWNDHPALISMGINRCGATERFYTFIATQLREQVYQNTVWRRLFDCETLQEQKDFYGKHFRTPEWCTAVRLLLSRTMHLQFFPAFMFVNASVNDFSSFFLRQFETELHKRLGRDNYFLSQLVLGEYLHNEPGGMPFYLTEDGYTQTQSNLHKLRVVPAGLTDALHDASEIDAFFLSNVFDWSDARAIKSTCDGIRLAKSETSVLLYRNLFATVDLTGHLAEMKRDDAFSEKLHHLERSMMYSNVTLATL